MKKFARSTTARGHFRAGLFWSPEGKERDLTEKQVAQLEADPRIAFDPVKRATKASPAKKDEPAKKG